MCKMRNFKNTISYFWICCIACVLAKNCDPTNKPPNWEISEFDPPSDLSLGLVPEVAEALEARIENKRENFTLTLFANPFIKDGNCPPANSSYHNLRQFHRSSDVIEGGKEIESIFFAKIFTGCYYVEMKNTEGKRWLWDPVFYSTNYHYYDTMLKCKKFEVKPKNNDQATDLKIELEMPLACSQVRIQLFKLPKITVKLIGHLVLGNTLISQDCWVKNIGSGQPPAIRCTSTNMIHPAISATPVSENNGTEGWSTMITWDSLKKDDTAYYASFKVYNGACNISYSDLMTWKPVANFGTVSANGLWDETDPEIYAYNSLDYS